MKGQTLFQVLQIRQLFRLKIQLKQGSAAGLFLILRLTLRKILLYGLDPFAEVGRLLCAELLAGAALETVAGFQCRPIHADLSAAHEVKLHADADKLCKGPLERLCIVSAEIRDRVVIRCLTPQQPPQLNVPMAFCLQSPRGAKVVEMPIHKQRQKILCRIGRPPCCRTHGMVEAQPLHIDRVCKHPDEPHHVLRADLAVQIPQKAPLTRILPLHPVAAPFLFSSPLFYHILHTLA